MSAATEPDTGRRSAGAPLGSDLAILIVRIVIGVLFLGHGTGKLFGWFAQGGVKGTGAFFESVGYKPGESLAIVAGVVEILAGVLLILGFVMPLAAAIIIGDMINASLVKSEKGFWVADGGFEYELVLSFLMLALVVSGPGAFAIDAKREWFRSRTGGVVVAIVLAALAGGAMVVYRA